MNARPPFPRAQPEPTVVLRPCAKLNLTLEVLGRRPDGYHDLASVFQAIDLRDELAIRPDRDLGLTCSVPDLGDDGNLVLRAARLLRAEAGIAAGARLHLEKRIPVAAGLGGGSSDAAATLVGLTRLWRLGWPRARLARLAERLGSDVPFFLGSPTALVTGKGEAISPLPSLSPHRALVVHPVLRQPAPSDKTRRLYAALRPEDYRDGSATRRLAQAIAGGAPLDPALLVNSFERAACRLFPEVAEAEAAMLSAGVPWVRLAGSGPCLYTLLRDGQPQGRRDAQRLADALRSRGLAVYLVRTVAGPLLLPDCQGAT